MNSPDQSAIFSEGSPSSPSFLLNSVEEGDSLDSNDSTHNLNADELEQRAQELLATLPTSNAPSYALQFDSTSHSTTAANPIPPQWNIPTAPEPQRIVLPRDPYVVRTGTDLKTETEASIAFLKHALAGLEETDWIYKTPNAFGNGSTGEGKGEGGAKAEPWLSTIF